MTTPATDPLSPDPPSRGPGASPAERVSTPVDGIDVLGAISPSRAGDFMTCPLLYRFRTIDRLPEQPSPDAVRGTVVHKVLEDLFDLPALDRTPERAAAMLVPAWDVLLETEPALAEMFGGEGPDVAAWLTSCRTVLDRYFDLEDPRRLEPADRELYVEALLDSKLLLRGFVDRVDVAPDGRIRVVDYKGLALDTPLPTPTGWTTMAEVAVGDELVGSDGLPTRVRVKSEVHHRSCYRVSFRDGSSVVADNVHLWRVVTSRGRQDAEQILDTDALRAELTSLREQGRHDSVWVEAAAPMALPTHDSLPIAPWLLGAWLGDGDTRAGSLSVDRPDAADMARTLRDEGLLGRKHIPRSYLRAGESQRIELVRGLMDADGSWNEIRRRAGFTTTEDRLACDVVELLHTLGVNPSHAQEFSTDAVRDGRARHVIEFTPTSFNPFSLPAKADLCERAITAAPRDLATRRIVASVDPVPSVPTQCVAVDAADSMYVCGTGFIPTHNTGRSPGVGYEAKALFQMKFYALVIWRLRGVVPSMLQLIYLGNGEILRYEPDEDDLRATERKVEAVWAAIRLAQVTGDWQPSPSRLCDWCSFHQFCPTKGGTIPPLPEQAAAVPDVSTDESDD